MKTPTLDQLLTADTVRDVRNYLAARVVAEIKRARVRPIQEAVLAEIPLMDTRVSERITNPREIYLCEDEAACQRYFTEVERRLIAAGIKAADRPPGECPALVAENLQCQAEGVLCEHLAPLFGIDASLLHLEKRDQFIDLVVGLVINHPKTRHHFTDAATVLQAYQPKNHAVQNHLG